MKIDPSLLYRDELTNIYNRRFLRDRVPELLQNLQKKGKPYAVLFLDIDKFKQINDTWGHKAGDQALIEFTNILKKSIRKKDILIRYGGDEFIIILPETSTQKAEEVARRIVKNLSVPRNWITRSYMRESSIGIAVYPYDAERLEKLIEIADARMYYAKKNGSGIICRSKLPPGSLTISLEENIIGREETLHQLFELLNRTQKGKFSNILLHGPFGVGKKELAEIIIDRAISINFYTLEHITKPFSGFENYSMIFEFTQRLRQLNQQMFNGILNVLPRGDRQIVSYFIDSFSINRRLEQSILKFLSKLIRHLSEKKPVVFLITNLEYIDPRSLKVMLNLLKDLQATRTMWIQTFDSTSLIFKKDTKHYVDALTSLSETHIFEIALLDANKIERLLSVLLGGPVSTEIAKQITLASKGLPSNVRKILDFLQRHQLIRYEDSHWKFQRGFEQTLKTWYKEHIKSLLATLTAKSILILETLDLLGEVDLEFLYSIIGGDRISFYEALTELSVLGLIKNDGSKISFKDNVIKEVVGKRRARHTKGINRLIAGKLLKIGRNNPDILLQAAKLFKESGAYKEMLEIIWGIIMVETPQGMKTEKIVSLLEKLPPSQEILQWKQRLIEHLKEIGNYEMVRRISSETMDTIKRPGIQWATFMILELESLLKLSRYGEIARITRENAWFLKRNGDLGNFIKALYIKGKAYEQMGEFESAKRSYIRAYRIARKYRLERYEILPLIAFVNICSKTNPEINTYKIFTKKLLPMIKSFPIYPEKSDWLYLEILDLYSHKDFIEEVLNLTRMNPVNDRFIHGFILRILSEAKLKTGEIREMIDNVEESLAILSTYIPKFQLIDHFVLLSLGFFMLDEREKLLKLMKELEKFSEFHPLFLLPQILYQIKTGRLEQAYSKFKQLLSFNNYHFVFVRSLNFILYLLIEAGFTNVDDEDFYSLLRGINLLPVFEKAILYFNGFALNLRGKKREFSGNYLSKSLFWIKRGLANIADRDIRSCVIANSPFISQVFHGLRSASV